MTGNAGWRWVGGRGRDWERAGRVGTTRGIKGTGRLEELRVRLAGDWGGEGEVVALSDTRFSFEGSGENGGEVLGEGGMESDVDGEV